MANNSPTLVMASLSDDQLRKSIDSLVTHVDEAMKKMVQSTNNAVGEMEAKLKSLGNPKIDSGGSADGGASKRTKAQNAETEAIEKNIAARDRQIKKNQETAMSFDRMANAQQVAIRSANPSGIRNADTLQTMNTQLDLLRERLREARQQYSSFVALAAHATTTGDKGLFQFATEGVHRYEQEVRNLIPQIRTLQSGIQQMGDVIAPQGHTIQNYVNSLQKANPELAALNAQYKSGTSLLQTQSTSYASATQSAQRYTEEIRKQAAAIRATKTWQEKGFAEVNGHVFKDPERVSGTMQQKREIGTLEEQILRSMQQQSIAERANTQEAQQRLDTIKGIAAAARAEMKKYGMSAYNTGYAVQNPYIYAENDARAKGLTIEQQIANILREQEAAYQASARSAAMVVEEEKKITQEQDKRKSYKAPVTTGNESFKQLTANALGVQPSEIDSTSTKIAKMTAYVRQLETAYSNLKIEERSTPFGKQLREEIQTTSRTIQKFRSEISRPINLQAALQGSEKTLDDIAYKMQRLSSYRSGLNIETQKSEIDQVNRKYTELQKKMNEVMQKNQQMIGSNTALGRSWNYMKNRLAFYVSVGASTQFIKNLIEVRSQYELNERALGILIGSAERGTQIFNELSQMALVSPYTLIELSSAAKQLTAYDVAARDVVDTTRRLADMASAVGIPMERLTYALGQIKAYGYLNSRDNRMFANAGIPLVKQLADYYTEFEGRLVSTADVYDRIKKKAVDYNTVMQVIYRMTDEGGKFFDFQAKMADTLKVRLANLTLAWNNMLNDMGKETQGVLTWGIGALRTLFLHWRELDKLIKNIAWIVGIRTAFMLLAYGALKFGGALGVTTKQMALSAVFGKRLAGVLRTVGMTMKSIVTSPLTWWSLLAVAAFEAATQIFSANEATVSLNKSLREGAETNFKDISDYLAQYQKVADSLYGGKSSNAYELQTGQYKTGGISTPTNINVNEANKAWEAMRERIELSTAASDDFVGRLLTIENVSERLRQGFKLLNDIQQVNSAMKDMGDTAIVVTQDWSKWWNLFMGSDGLINNLKDYKNAQDGATFSMEKFGQGLLRQINAVGVVYNIINGFADDDDKAFKILKSDIDDTTESIDNFIRNMGFASNPDQIAAVYAQALKQISAQGNLDPQTAYDLQQGVEDARGKAMKEALEARIADETAALKLARDNETKASLKASIARNEAQLELFTKYTNDQRTEWERFTKYMKENHISEMQAMFGQMDEEQIKSINWQEEKYLGFVKRTAAAYAKRHNMAYEDVFNRLWGLIQETNLMQIFLKLTISTEGQKSITDLLVEYDQQADAALTKIQRNQRRLQEMVAMGWNSAISNHYKEYLQLKRETDDLIANYNDVTSKEKGGHAKQADKANEKAEKAAAAARAKAAREAAKTQREGETELQKAIKDSLQIIEKERRSFDEMTKSSVPRIKAIERATSGFSDTVKNINAVFGKYGIPLFDPKVFAGTDDPHAVLSYLEDVLNNVKLSKFVKPEDIKMLDLKINEINVDVAKYDSDKITKGLNNELNKLSEEYELSLAFDADPDLGNIFADMFQIDIDSLPNSFGELVELANAEIKKALEKKGVDTNKVFFDILASNILDNEKDVAEGIYGLATRIGETEDSKFIKTLISFQNKFKENYKKIISDNNKMLEDLVKKYGNYTDKVAEIESDKIESIKKLNDEYYNDELRKRPEYAARIAAINNDAEKKLSNALFEEFKNSRLYIAMFENIEYAATSTLEAISNELDGLKSKLKNLSPEQLKTIYTQYEKIQKEFLRRNPFKNLIKNAKAYTKAVGKSGKAAQKEFVQTEKKYKTQTNYVASLKKQLETLKATQPQNKIAIDLLSDQVNIEDEKLKKLKEEYELAQKLNDTYNLMRIVFGDQSAAITKAIQTVAQNLESLSDFRDTLNNLFGIDADKGETLFGHTLDAVIDDLSDVGKSLNNIVSSAQSMNVVGVATGVVGVVTGIGDAVASLFGDGKKRTKRINREIVKSQEEVRKLEMAYKELERAIDRENGKEETRARREQIANKEAQLAEIERQKALEESKRKKDRDNDAIKSYEENAQDLRHEIEDLKKGVVDDLFGTEVKSAADEFVDAWVDAWKAGEKTLDAMKEKMNDMMMTLVKNAISSRIVQNLLQPVYDKVDEFTQDKSDGSYDLTQAELTALANLSANTGEKIDTALTSFYENLERLGITAKEIEESKELSALQAGISGITEEQASALEAYWNINTQEQFKHTTLLTQIRDLLSGSSGDVQIGVQAQMLLQLQQSYQVQMSIHSTLQGWTNPSGQAVRVELIS